MVSRRGCVRWCQKRSNMEITLLTLSSLLLLTLLLIILFGATFQGKKSNFSPEEGGTCWTQECIVAAGEILSPMNADSDACNHFYDFACGRYSLQPGQSSSAKKQSKDLVNSLFRTILESKERISVNGLQDLRNFYDTCMQFGNHRLDSQTTRKTLKELMKEFNIGDWPMIDSDYDLNEWSIHLALAKLTLLDIPVVFRMDIVPDKHTGIYLLRIGPGGPREKGRNPDDIKSNIQLKSSILTPLVMIAQSTGKSKTDVDGVLHVDGELAVIHQVHNTSCDTVMIPPHEVDSELERLVYNVNWKIVLSEIRKATGILRPFAVQLRCKQEIRDYMENLNTHTVSTVANYLGWRFFSSFVDHIVPVSGSGGQQELDERLPQFKACLDLLKKFANPLLAECFTKKVMSDKWESEAEKIFMDVVRTTQQLVSRAGWLSQSQRSKISEKVYWFIEKFPFKSNSYGAKMTVNLPGVDVSNFTAAVVLHQRKMVLQRFHKLSREGMESDIDEYFVIPDDFFSVLPPFFRPDVPQWINYGGFGVFVARQISKFILSGEDDSFNVNTSVWNVWIKNAKYHKCISDSELASLNDTMKIPVLHERFLDRSSIEIAFESAKLASGSGSLPAVDMSQEKMFFLAHAQTLCDRTSQNAEHIRERVDSTVSTFREDFGCESPPVQCRIWA